MFHLKQRINRAARKIERKGEDIFNSYSYICKLCELAIDILENIPLVKDEFMGSTYRMEISQENKYVWCIHGISESQSRDYDVTYVFSRDIFVISSVDITPACYKYGAEIDYIHKMDIESLYNRFHALVHMASAHFMDINIEGMYKE